MKIFFQVSFFIFLAHSSFGQENKILRMLSNESIKITLILNQTYGWEPYKDQYMNVFNIKSLNDSTVYIKYASVEFVDSELKENWVRKVDSERFEEFLRRFSEIVKKGDFEYPSQWNCFVTPPDYIRVQSFNEMEGFYVADKSSRAVFDLLMDE